MVKTALLSLVAQHKPFVERIIVTDFIGLLSCCQAKSDSVEYYQSVRPIHVVDNSSAWSYAEHFHALMPTWLQCVQLSHFMKYPIAKGLQEKFSHNLKCNKNNM